MNTLDQQYKNLCKMALNYKEGKIHENDVRYAMADYIYAYLTRSLNDYDTNIGVHKNARLINV